MFEATRATVNQSGPIKLTIRCLRAAGWRLAPARCLLCGAQSSHRQLDICVHCLARFPSAGQAWLPGTAPIDWVLGPWSYQYPIDALVRGMKFAGERAYARLLGTLLARHRAALPLPMPERVVPMPLHPRRLRQRGYNQAAEIAMFAARELGLELDARSLRRVRDTQAQTRLPEQLRRANLQGAFNAARDFTGRRIALIDDVITTGSTARAAAAALAIAGAAHIELWVLACAARRSTRA